jgi:hypothetical protein
MKYKLIKNLKDMSKGPVYWTTAEGRVIDVDDMDDRHAKNALKMMIRRERKMRESQNTREDVLEATLKYVYEKMFNDNNHPDCEYE